MSPLAVEWLSIALTQSNGITGRFDLNTAFLTILLALAGWTLHGVQRHEKSLTQVEQQLWGKDGKNGHASELRNMNESLEGLERFLTRVDRRIDRIEMRLKLEPLPDDSEDDTRS